VVVRRPLTGRFTAAWVAEGVQRFMASTSAVAVEKVVFWMEFFNAVPFLKVMRCGEGLWSG